MPTTLLSTSYRPVRAAILVGDGGLTVAGAAALNTILWGGAANPMVDVATAERYRAFLSTGRIDTIHPLENPTDPILKVARELGAFGGELAFTFAPREDASRAGALDVLMPFSHHAASKHADSDQWALYTWDPSHRYAAALSLMFGAYANGALGQAYESAYRAAFNPVEIRIDASLPPSCADRLAPIDATMLSLRRHQEWNELDGVFVGDPTDPAHLVDYWNIKASGWRVAFWSPSDPPFFEEAVAAHIRREAALLQRFPEGFRSLAVWWPSRPELVRGKIPHELQALFPSDVVAHPCPVDYLYAGEGRAHRPIDLGFGMSVTATVEAPQSLSTPRVVIPLPPHPFPDARLPERSHQSWFLEIRVYGDVWPGYSLVPPFIPALNGVWSDWIGMRTTTVRARPETVSVLQSHDIDTCVLGGLPDDVAVAECLKFLGVRSSPSDHGVLASRAAVSLGGGLGMGGGTLGILRHPVVRRLLTSKDARRGMPARHAHDILRAAEKSPEAALAPKLFRLPQPRELFALLVERRFFRVGLYLRCPHCWSRALYEPSALEADTVCVRCGDRFEISSAILTGEWRFRVNGFLDAEGQGGLLPVLLTMMFLRRHNLGREVTVVPGRKLSNGEIECEADVIAMETFEGRFGLALFECKGGGEITEADLQNLETVAGVARREGIAACVGCATTREAFTDAELDRFRSFVSPADSTSGDSRASGTPLILLTARELSADFPFADDEQVRHRQARTFREIAENSAARYLGD